MINHTNRQGLTLNKSIHRFMETSLIQQTETITVCKRQKRNSSPLCAHPLIMMFHPFSTPQRSNKSPKIQLSPVGAQLFYCLCLLQLLIINDDMYWHLLSLHHMFCTNVYFPNKCCVLIILAAWAQSFLRATDKVLILEH